ncbi:MAG: hypothetical protein IJ790_00815 [Lachnospiraceae bacterium]|nr:hypothetical protein [Lachnospiraceae bacterium]
MLNEERSNIESDIEYIRFIGGKGTITKKRAKYILYNIESINKIKMQIEKRIFRVKNEVDRDILYLRFIKGLTIREIGDKINYSSSAVSRRLLKYEN